jgi:ribonucrease Y
MEYVWIVVALIIAGAIEFGALKYVLKSKYKRVLDEAAKEADVIKEKKLLEVKEKFLNKKAELEKEVQQRNQKILQVENKLKQREMSLSQKQEDLGKRKVELDNTQNKLNAHAQLLKTKEEELEKMQLKEREKLEELSGLSAEEAKKRLVDSLKDEARTNAQSYINEIMDDAKMTANKEAKRIVIQTIQRVATETAIENSVTVFHNYLDFKDLNNRKLPDTDKVPYKYESFAAR